MVLGSLALAVLVNRQLPGIHWFRAAFYTPVLVSIVVAAIAFRWLYAETGLINGWLSALVPGGFKPIGFLTNPLLALPSVMVVTLWKGLGYYMVIFLAGLQGISADLYEAAELDGSEDGANTSTSPCRCYALRDLGGGDFSNRRHQGV